MKEIEKFEVKTSPDAQLLSWSQVKYTTFETWNWQLFIQN